MSTTTTTTTTPPATAPASPGAAGTGELMYEVPKEKAGVTRTVTLMPSRTMNGRKQLSVVTTERHPTFGTPTLVHSEAHGGEELVGLLVGGIFLVGLVLLTSVIRRNRRRRRTSAFTPA